MGNYQNLEKEFIERSMALIAQYEHILHEYEFKYQYNYTLLINCLLGVIVMPKERTISYIPSKRLTLELLKSMGLEDTVINEDINYLRDFIIALRNSVAHFDISIFSNDDKYLIDEIVFKDREKGEDYEIVRFRSEELLPFIRYYVDWILHNLKNHKEHD